MPGIDKPTGRVIVLIVLMILVAAALRGYLPVHENSTRQGPGGSRTALLLLVAALGVTLSLLAVAIIARLRDPVAVAPSAGDLSDMLGRGRERPSWRVLVIGIVVILAWLLIAILLAQLFAPPDVVPPASTPDPSTPPGHAPAPPPEQHPQHDNNGDMLGILLASAVPLVLMLVVGAVVITSRRRRRLSAPGAVRDDPVEPPAPAALVRAAELGLAEVADPGRDPREAIIACYAAMERELANVPGAVPQDFDTPTEVLARAVDHHALHADNGVQLVVLFAEARFSPHVMNEGHREEAVRILQLVLDELALPSRSRSMV